jgi:hypothetical protein
MEGLHDQRDPEEPVGVRQTQRKYHGDCMNKLKNEKGIALITALLLTMIALLVMMAVIYMITQGIQVSAAHKRYSTTLEASYGGVEVFTKEIISKSLLSKDSPPSLDPLLNASFSRYTGCFQKKLNNPTNKWESLGCGGDAMTIDPKVTPDTTFLLQGLPSQGNFKIYSKIVDTVPGNSDGSGIELLESGAGVAYGNSGVSPQHVPSLYRVEVQGERENNPKEKARLTVLYAN